MDGFLRQVWELDEPIVIRVRHELDPAQQRLILALGAGYVVDPAAPPCERLCGRRECSVSAIATRRWCRINGCGFEPDEGSEFCRTHRFSAGETNGRELLDRMDAAEPVSPTRAIDVPFVSTDPDDNPDEIEEREPEADEATVAGAQDFASANADLGPAEPSRSSSTGPVEPAPAPEGEDERAAGDGASTNGRAKWTREKAIAAIREVGEPLGRAPAHAEMRAAGYGSCITTSFARRFGTTWRGLVEEAGFEPNARGELGGKRVSGHKSSGREPQAVDDPGGQAPDTGRTVSPPPAGTGEAASRPDREPHRPATPPPDVVEPEHLALANVADLTVNASAWIDALESEAGRLERRAEALRMIAAGLIELEETAP